MKPATDAPTGIRAGSGLPGARPAAVSGVVPVGPAPAVSCEITANPLGLDPAGLYGVARRYNARRSALFVSLVLGKHVPAPPAAVIGAGRLLATRVATHDEGDLAGAVVISFAETATALGHLVRDGLAAPHLMHTTRVPVDRTPILCVEEEHSHATTHRIHHADPAVLDGTGPLVLVDDELTTGRTMRNLIAAVHTSRPRPRYLVASLLDWRDDAARGAFEELAARLSTRIEVVSLLAGTVSGAILDGVPPVEDPPVAVPERPAASHRVIDLPVPATARLGWGAGEQGRFERALPAAAAAVAEALPARGGPLHCVGTEELMYGPLRIAAEVAALRPDRTVTYHSTTRSPIVVADVEGYPVRHCLRFPHHAEPERESRLHNVDPAAGGDLVVFVEGPVERHRLAPMVSALGSTGAAVHVVVLTGRSP
jgi:hypothetical protein